MGFEDVKRAFPDRDAKVLAIINQKGGVGKSTTAVNLSAALGENKKKCLVIDLDPQGNTTSGYGIEKEELEYDVYDALLQDYPIENLIADTVEPNVFVIPATIQLAGAEIELVSAMARESILKSILDPIKNKFDYVFIDCPPSLGLLTINALVAADSLLIPIQCEFYALEGVTKLLESMKMVKARLNPDLDVFGVVMTMYDARTNLSMQVVENVKENLHQNIYKTIIPRNVRLAEAPSHGLPINLYDSRSAGAEAYRRLAKEVVNHRA